MRHRCADADRCKHHDVVCKLEHDLREALHRAEDWLPPFANRGDGECENHAEYDDLQNVAAHHGVNHTGRKYVHDSLDESFRMTLLNGFDGVDVRGGESHARPGLGEIDYSQPNEQRCRGDDLEIDQRFDSHAPHFPKRACASDTNYNCREHERRDDGFDQVNEDVAQKINCVPPIGSEPADHTADNQPYHDLRR